MGYSSGDWRTPGKLPPKIASFMQWSQNTPAIQAITADPRYAGNTPAQRRARQAAIHRVIVQSGQHIPEGLKINADGKLETDDQSGIPAWGKALIAGGIAAGAIFGAPALAGALGVGGGGAGAGAAGAAGTAGAAGSTLGPATAASMAETAGIVGGSTVPASLAALTPAELAGLGAAGGAAGAAVGTSGAGSTAGATGAAAGGSGAAGAGPMVGGTPLADFTGPIAPTGASGSSSWLGGGVGKALGSPYVLGAGISAGAGLLGAKIQSNANRDAAQIQTDFLREALDYEKKRDTYAQQLEASRYGDLNSRLTPYISSGQNANARMAQILGLPAPDTATMGTAPTPMGSPNTAPTYATRTGLDTSGPSEGTAMPRPGGTLLRAPDGSLRQVPPEQVPHFVSRGAQVVNG